MCWPSLKPVSLAIAPAGTVPRVDAGAVGEPAGRKAGHAARETAQGRAADVLAHGSEVLGGRRAAVGIDVARAAQHQPRAVGIRAVELPVDDSHLPRAGPGRVLLLGDGHVGAVPANRLAGPELAVVGHANDGSAGLLG